MMSRLIPIALCTLVLAGCETPKLGVTPPQVGASDQMLEPGRFRVTYRGESHVGRTEVRDHALLHAAEVALANGYDWFEIVDRHADVGPPTSAHFSMGVGSAAFGSRSAVGVGGSTTFGGRATAVESLEIVAGKGAKPDGVDAYDARAVADALRAGLG